VLAVVDDEVVVVVAVVIDAAIGELFLADDPQAASASAAHVASATAPPPHVRPRRRWEKTNLEGALFTRGVIAQASTARGCPRRGGTLTLDRAVSADTRQRSRGRPA
jgi:hypothetical protein